MGLEPAKGWEQGHRSGEVSRGRSLRQEGCVGPYLQQHNVIFEASTGIFGMDDPVSNTDLLLAPFLAAYVVGSQNHSDPHVPARKHHHVPAALATGTQPPLQVAGGRWWRDKPPQRVALSKMSSVAWAPSSLQLRIPHHTLTEVGGAPC